MKTKKTGLSVLLSVALTIFLFSCGGKTQQPTDAIAEAPAGGGQSSVKDDESQKDVVRVAVGSADHTTLVTALKTASYVDALSNAGPFTVFAPTNAAFDKLPAGTVEDLVKPENKDKLQNILEYHVYVGVIRESMVNGSMNLNQVNGKNVTLSK